MVMLGLAGAGATTLMDLGSFLIFGPLLLASSVLQLAIAMFAEKGTDRLLHLGSAGLEAFLGFFIMAHPHIVIADLVTLTAAALIISGLLRLARFVAQRSPSRGWIVLTGSVALVLGICVWLRVPVSGLWFVGLCIALDFICHGITWAAIGLLQGRPLEESVPN